MTFTQNAAFWVFNMVSNFAYTRYELISVDIRKKQLELENKYISEINGIDKQALDLLKSNKKVEAIKFLTDFSVRKGNDTHKDWQMLYAQLFAKYMDGNVKEKSAVKENYKFVAPKLSQPGYGDEFYKNVVKETGDKFLIKGDSH